MYRSKSTIALVGSVAVAASLALSTAAFASGTTPFGQPGDRPDFDIPPGPPAFVEELTDDSSDPEVSSPTAPSGDEAPLVPLEEPAAENASAGPDDSRGAIPAVPALRAVPPAPGEGGHATPASPATPAIPPAHSGG